MDNLSTRDTCFNPMYFSVLFDLRDMDNLSTRDKIVVTIVSLPLFRGSTVMLFLCVVLKT